MTKTSVVKDIKSAGQPYEGQYGTLYGFYVTFENGDNGKYNSKSEHQTKFVVGQEATYEYIGREYQGKTYFTVKPVNPQYANVTPTSSGKSVGNSSKDEIIVRQTALKAAAELGGTPQQVIANAQTFADWVMKKAELQTSQEQHFAGRQEGQSLEQAKANLERKAQPKAQPQPVDAEGLPF
jgi:hypothetical protein